jgi:RNA polymerase sigma factor (sigma-70 family)
MVAARLSAKPSQAPLVDDVTQQAMTGIAVGLPRLENQTVAGLKAYASVIVARRVADCLQQMHVGPDGPAVRSLESTVRLTSRNGTLGSLLAASGSTPSRQATRAELLSRVLLELERMRPVYRDVITLAFFDQLTTEQIANRLEISRPAASMLLLRAVRKLRTSLTDVLS